MTIVVLTLAACSTETPLMPDHGFSDAQAPQQSSGAATATTPVSNHFAYWLADEPTRQIYSPDFRFAPDWPFAAHVEVSRVDVGHYTPFVGKMSDTFRPGSKEVVITSTYGATTTQCTNTQWFSSLLDDRMFFRFDCDDMRTGARADAVFSTLVVGNNTLPAPLAFTFAGQPTAASYTPDTAMSFTTGTGAMLIERIGTGDWYVHLGTGNPQGSIFLAASFEEGILCSIAEWKNFGARVRCFDRTGALTNASYRVLQISRGSPSMLFGWLWADRHTATAPYQPARSFSSSGGAINVTRTSVGDYLVDFGGLQVATLLPENIQVSAFGMVYSSCTIVSMGVSPTPGRLVRVQCRNAGGNLADSRFNLLFIG